MGAMANKEVIEQLYKSFNPLETYGLPHPGDYADFGKSATTVNMRDLAEDFKRILDEFVRCTFEENFPVPVRKAMSSKILTASNLIDYLETIAVAFGECAVAGGDPMLVAMHLAETIEAEYIAECDQFSMA